MYESNTQSVDFDDLPFDNDEGLISGRQIYRINDNIVERSNNSLIIDVHKNQV